MSREIIQPKGLWDPRPRFAQVVRTGKQVYVAGQTSVDGDGNLVGRGRSRFRPVKSFRTSENVWRRRARISITW